MKKILCIVLAVFFIIMIGLGVIAYINRNTIAALFDAMKYTNEEVEQKMQENKKDLQEFIEKDENIVVRDLTEEEKVALNENKITQDDAVSIITGQKTLDEVLNSSEQKPLKDKPSVKDEPQKPSSNASGDSDKRISELIASLYVEKNTRLAAFDSLKAQVYQEYKGIEGVEHETKKWDLINKYTPVLAQWESDCDSVVYGIIDQIRAELKKAGKDESIATKLKESYLNEKKLKKASLAAKYLD